MKRMALILWLALCAGAGAAWIDPNTNASWCVLPVQAYTNGSLASPANFFSANRHAINNMFSNRGAVVNGYVPRFAYASTDINEWIVISEDPSVYELMGSALRIYNASFTGPTTGTIILPSTNAYIEINTAYDAAIGFADIEINYQADAPIRTIADEYEPATSAPFGDHINRLYIRPTTTALVTGIRIYGFETNTFIGLTNDFAGITVRVDDPVDQLSPVNLHTFNRLLAAGISNTLEQAYVTAGAQSTNASAQWHIYPAPRIQITNGWIIAETNQALEVSKDGTNSVTICGSGLSVNGSLTINDSTVTSFDFAPAATTNLTGRVDALEGMGFGWTNSPTIVLTDGSRSTTNPSTRGHYVHNGPISTFADTAAAKEQLYFAYYNPSGCSEPTRIKPGDNSANHLKTFKVLPRTNTAYTCVGSWSGVTNLDGSSFSLTNFYQLSAAVYFSGEKLAMNPNREGFIRLARTAVSNFTSVAQGNPAAVSMSVMEIELGTVKTGRLYLISMVSSNVGSTTAGHITVSFGGDSHSAICGKPFSEYFFATTTNSLEIVAETFDSGMELDDFSILLVDTTHTARVSGRIATSSGIDTFGDIKSTRRIFAAEMFEGGYPLSNRYISVDAHNDLQSQVNAQTNASFFIGAGRAIDLSTNNNNSTELTGKIRWGTGVFWTTNGGSVIVPGNRRYDGALSWTMAIKYRRINTNISPAVGAKILAISGLPASWGVGFDDMYYGHGLVLSNINAYTESMQLAVLHRNDVHTTKPAIVNYSRSDTSSVYMAAGSYNASSGISRIWFTKDLSVLYTAENQTTNADYLSSFSPTNGIVLNGRDPNAIRTGLEGIEVHEAAFYDRCLSASEITNLYVTGVTNWITTNLMFAATFDLTELYGTQYIPATSRLVVVDGFLVGGF